jgi:chemotaxis protein CheY-P-specific phosphatase CheC
LMTGAPQNKATNLGHKECSALAEIGNVALAYFVNAIAETIGLSETLHLSPPVVVVDMLDDILELIVKPAADVSDAPLVIETVLQDITRNQWFRFWVLPESSERTVKPHA